LLLDYEGNVHKNPLEIQQEAIMGAEKREAELNENSKRLNFVKIKISTKYKIYIFSKYLALAQNLYQICTNKELHWRHVDFAQSLLTLLLRRDAHLQDDIVLHFFHLLNSDSIKTRKMAVGFCATWMKINRQKAAKVVHDVLQEAEPNLGPGAQWPIKFGLRKDNRFLFYQN
jgi:hypothetical protein